MALVWEGCRVGRWDKQGWHGAGTVAIRTKHQTNCHGCPSLARSAAPPLFQNTEMDEYISTGAKLTALGDERGAGAQRTESRPPHIIAMKS